MSTSKVGKHCQLRGAREEVQWMEGRGAYTEPVENGCIDIIAERALNDKVKRGFQSMSNHWRVGGWGLALSSLPHRKIAVAAEWETHWGNRGEGRGPGGRQLGPPQADLMAEYGHRRREE